MGRREIKQNLVKFPYVLETILLFHGNCSVLGT